MPDDMVSLGGPGRRADRRREADRAIEALFRAGYPRIVRAAQSAAGDLDGAERLAQDAYLRLWRQPWLIAEPRAAHSYLLGAVAGTAGGAAKYADPPASPPVDADRGWRDLRLRRARWERNRKATWIAGASVVAVAALAISASALYGTLAGAAGSHRARVRPSPAPPRAYPGAVVASIPLRGVIDVLGDAGRVWAVRAVRTSASTSVQLVAINTDTNTASVSVNLGSPPVAVAAGGGTMWVTTSSGSAGGLLRQIDPTTGGILRSVRLPTGRCSFLAYSGAHLFAGCATNGSGAIAVVRLDPRTGKVAWQADSASVDITQIAATPTGIWYADRYLGIVGPVTRGARVGRGLPYGVLRPISFANPQALVYGDRFLWALGIDESVNKIDPGSGRVVRVYTYRSYDPGLLGGLDNLAVGGGSLWFLDDGSPQAGPRYSASVLRVSEGTGRPVARIPAIAPGSCGSRPCFQIYYTQGAVWVPTARSLIKIAPSRLPATPYSTAFSTAAEVKQRS